MLISYISLTIILLTILTIYAFFIGFIDGHDSIETIKKKYNISDVNINNEPFENMLDTPFSNEYTYIVYDDGTIKTIKDKKYIDSNDYLYPEKKLNKMNVTTLVIGNTVTSLGEKYIRNPLYNNTHINLNKVIFSPGSEPLEINNACFANSKLNNIYLPSRLIQLGEYAFYNNINLVNIYIPIDINCNKISKGAFSNCRSLRYMFIPNVITTMESMAFFNCINLSYLFMSQNMTYTSSKGTWSEIYYQFYKTNLINGHNTNRNISVYFNHYKSSKLPIVFAGKVSPRKYTIDIWNNPIYMNSNIFSKGLNGNWYIKWKLLNSNLRLWPDNYNYFTRELKKQAITSGYHRLIKKFKFNKRIILQPQFNNIKYISTTESVPPEVSSIGYNGAIIDTDPVDNTDNLINEDAERRAKEEADRKAREEKKKLKEKLEKKKNA